MELDKNSGKVDIWVHFFLYENYKLKCRKIKNIAIKQNKIKKNAAKY